MQAITRRFYQVQFAYVDHLRTREVISDLTFTIHAASPEEAQELAIEDIEAYGYSHGPIKSIKKI